MPIITWKKKWLKSQLNSVEGTSHSKKKTGSAQSTVLTSYRYFDLMVDLSAKFVCLFSTVRTCFPGVYWVLPWECSHPKGGIIQFVIDRCSDYIGQDRDSCHLGTQSTILQHFTHTQWNLLTHSLLLADVTLCFAMYPAGKFDISQHLAIPWFSQSDNTVGKSSGLPNLKSVSHLLVTATDTNFHAGSLEQNQPLFSLESTNIVNII